jgi:phosphatidylinositol alpha-1,6-mannosyltransferase
MEGRQTLIDRAPKILFLTPGCFDKGGISRYCRYQIEALRELLGPEQVRTLSLLGPTHDGFETPFDVTWHGGNSTASFAARFRFVLQALRHAVVWRPDVIHCAHVNLTPLVALLKLLSGATTVLNVYGLELWSGLSKARATHLARIDRVIADCHATAHHVVSEKMHPAAPTVIWDCADLDRFRPGPPSPHLAARYGLPDLDAHRVVLTLGRLSVSARHKGFDRLLDTWGNVRERTPKARLVIAGQGDDAERLEAKAAELGHADSVIFTGPIDEQDLAAIYRAAHVFCLVSDKGPGRGEGIPLTPIEALASGLPVVVGDEDGSREAVDGCRNGIVVSPRDPRTIANALVTLLTETGDARETRVIEARAVAEERFGYQAFAFKHKNFYSRWVGQN